MMPSGNKQEYPGGAEESNFVYEGIIIPAVQAVLGDDVEIIREVDSRKPGAITSAIVRRIAEADIAIVDLTGENPNVFLELGMRYALRKTTTILLTQSPLSIPFDIKNYRCIEYRPIYRGVEKAKEGIKEALKHSIEDNDEKVTDSLVFQVFPNLEVLISDSKSPDLDGTMPWTVYKKSLQRIIELMQEPFIGGRYVPIIIVGITNGGGIFADLLARDCYSGRVPITSLWANRTNQNEYFFNPLNEAAAKVINDLAEGKPKPSLLLVDDIVASGTTHHQAIKFLMSRLPGLDIRFLPLFSRNEKYFDLVKERIIWKHQAFDLPDAEIFKLHHTDWLRLPYDKDIRSS